MVKESKKPINQGEKRSGGTLILRENMPYNQNEGCTYTDEELRILINRHFPHYANKKKTG